MESSRKVKKKRFVKGKRLVEERKGKKKERARGASCDVSILEH